MYHYGSMERRFYINRQIKIEQWVFADGKYSIGSTEVEGPVSCNRLITLKHWASSRVDCSRIDRTIGIRDRGLIAWRGSLDPLPFHPRASVGGWAWHRSPIRCNTRSHCRLCFHRLCFRGAVSILAPWLQISRPNQELISYADISCIVWSIISRHIGVISVNAAVRIAIKYSRPLGDNL